MRLTSFSDYALRMLMYGAAVDRLFTVAEVSTAYGISRTHLMKVANLLTRAGYLKAVRGRSGGLIIAKPLAEIGLKDVIEATERDYALVECLGADNQCSIAGRCKLRGVLTEALDAFTNVLSHYTLADLVLPPGEARRLDPRPRRPPKEAAQGG